MTITLKLIAGADQSLPPTTSGTTERDFMLVVSRKVSEKITVATPCGAVIVTLVRIGGESVRIGIDAPREFRIMRNELIEESFSPQHDGALDPVDGGPPGPPILPRTENVS